MDTSGASDLCGMVMIHPDLGVRWSNRCTLSDGSMEDQAMEHEANHGHQGLGSCPWIVSSVNALEAIDRDQTVGLRGSIDRCAIVVRSWSDRRAIVVRSRRDRATIVAHLGQNQDHD